jgi:hypothetical protein
VLVGEPELYRDGFRLETTDVLTLSQAEDWCRQKSQGRPPPRPIQRSAAKQTRPSSE